MTLTSLPSRNTVRLSFSPDFMPCTIFTRSCIDSTFLPFALTTTSPPTFTVSPFRSKSSAPAFRLRLGGRAVRHDLLDQRAGLVRVQIPSPRPDPPSDRCRPHPATRPERSAAQTPAVQCPRSVRASLAAAPAGVVPDRRGCRAAAESPAAAPVLPCGAGCCAVRPGCQGHGDLDFFAVSQHSQVQLVAGLHALHDLHQILHRLHVLTVRTSLRHRRRPSRSRRSDRSPRCRPSDPPWRPGCSARPAGSRRRSGSRPDSIAPARSAVMIDAGHTQPRTLSGLRRSALVATRCPAASLAAAPAGVP